MKKNDSQPRGLDGYGQPPAKTFSLAPHQRLLPLTSHSRLTLAAEAWQDNGLRLLRDPKGRPVIRSHADLQPGEISLVLR